MPPRRARAAAQSSEDQSTLQVLEALALRHWAADGARWDAGVADEIMAQHIAGRQYARSSVQALERLQYLERALWPHYTVQSSDAHVLSIVLLINEKRQQGVDVWGWIGGGFAGLLQHVVALTADRILGPLRRTVGGMDAVAARVAVVQFLVAAFGSLEVDHVRSACLELVGVGMWAHAESQVLMEREYAAEPQLRRLARHVEKKRLKAGGEWLQRCRDFLPALLRDLAASLANPLALAYCTKTVELLVDVESQLASRRFANLLLIDHQIVDLCERCPWYTGPGAEALVFRGLVDRLRACVYFPIGDVSGRVLADGEATARHYRSVGGLQLTAFREFPRVLEPLALATVAMLARDPAAAGGLASHLEALDDVQLKHLATLEGVRTRSVVDPDADYDRAFVVHAFCERFRLRSPDAELMESALPTERLLLGPLVEAETQAVAAASLALAYPCVPAPKLGLQFLSASDYLGRCLELVRAESACAMRESINDVARRLQPRHDTAGEFSFAGWARMAAPLRGSVEIVDVRRPRIGELAPQRVRARVCADLAGLSPALRAEWRAEVRPRDVLVLLGFGPGGEASQRDSIVSVVRCCEVECRLDADGRPLGDESGAAVDGWRVLLDPHQYHADSDNVYAALGAVMRLRPQESNFKAVLETIRDLLASPSPQALLPAWLAATFLGYGDPAAATPAGRQLMGQGHERVYFGDTFLSADHVRETLLAPDAGTIEFADGCDGDDGFSGPSVAEFCPGGRVIVSRQPQPPGLGSVAGRQLRVLGGGGGGGNSVRFTAAQVAAIRSAAHEGLTLVVGPPGTGKTDVAVQIIANLYHAHPDQTILLVTHSNQALNQLFEKIIALGTIEPRHLLRLGHGEEALDAEESFSKAGRVESLLDRRRELLALAQRLADSLGVPGDFAASCEAARLLFVAHVRTRWESYRNPKNGLKSVFPFAAFFDAELSNGVLMTPSVDSKATNEEEEGCFRFLEGVFTELAALQPFELLRTSSERAAYLLTSQARIVAMTCTHASLRRSELLRLRFRYDTVVMEEAAQALDIEAFIPLTLQQPSSREPNTSRLRRLVLIGDHNQLPPVVRSTGLRAFSHMEQSMFARLVRLGVPYVELNRQARMRPELASLFRFRYRDLGDLEPLVTQGAFTLPNPGLHSTFQFINVGAFKNKEESEPTRFFYQNLGEAEYVVALYQYMRLLGYAAERIAILTTYNGQLSLIRDVLERRCAWLPFFGRPRAISTVDQFQGQQADFVLLSLVRTKSVGHVRDLRRLTVALSRARLGLYVFGCRRLLESCFELQNPMALLLANGDRLALHPEESVGTACVRSSGPRLVNGVEDMGKLVFGMIENHVDAVAADTSPTVLALDSVVGRDGDNTDVRLDDNQGSDGYKEEDTEEAE
ncbi:hypothetical protein GGI02_000896 [Coemansia sp. RSA 2322]|nr:hypothetical protein GGI02_000896 [Coemansia sp. RSA 2322]